MKKNKNKKLGVLALIAGILFFISYFTTKVTLNFILGCTWICISMMYFAKGKENKNKR